MLPKVRMMILFAVLFAEFTHLDSARKRKQKLFIINGEEAKPHSWPWQVSIKYRAEPEWSHYCGGSVITMSWIMTGAHCFFNDDESLKYKNPEEVVVLFGAHYVVNKEKNGYIVQRLLANIVNHPNYIHNDKYNHPNDIALGKTKRPVPFNDRIQPVALPKPTEELIPGITGYVTGWGQVYESPDNDLNRLHRYNGNFDCQVTRGRVEKMGHVVQDCGVWYIKDTKYDKRIVLAIDTLQQQQVEFSSKKVCHERMPLVSSLVICSKVRDQRKGSCNGDSGGPIVVNIHGVWIQYGINSNRRFPPTGEPDCGSLHQIDVYTKVSRYVPWIRKIMNHYS